MPSGARMPSVAHTRRFDSEPSGPMSNAVSRIASVSAMISVRPSGVITGPFGKCRSVAATCTLPSGSTRASRAVG